MADRRVTDLSYGHFGAATYDPEEKQWSFSTSFESDLSIEQIDSYEECSPPCIDNMIIEDEKPSIIVRNQMKEFLRVNPEMYHSKKILTALLATQISEEPPDLISDIFAIGYAVDINRISGSRRPLILASPCGGAGQILQLLGLRQEIRKWGRSRAKLSVLGNAYSRPGYWTNTGGTIRQIIFSGTENETATWLAVRQDFITTIFRPIYGQPYHEPWNPGASRKTSTFSLLQANPVATLPASENSVYSDITFNPWYSRQFAVIDSCGCWNICELEKSHQRNSPEKVVKGSTGNIDEGFDSETLSQSQSLGRADGWHRILWVCDIGTIIACNRYHLAIFNVTNKPTKLEAPAILSKGSSDWILDMKRSSTDKTQVFVLTTSRIFWIQVVPHQEMPLLDKIRFSGGRIILSQRHFRGPSDESLKLLPVKGGNISILVTSSKHPLINVYWFGRSFGSCCSPYSRRSSFTLSRSPELQILVQTGQILSCVFTSNSESCNLKTEEQYHSQGVEFFQFYILTQNLQLVSTLIATKLITRGEASNLGTHIKAPDRKYRKNSHRLGLQVTDDCFIVPDVISNQESLVLHPYNRKIQGTVDSREIFGQRDLRLRLDWRKVFQQVFPVGDVEGETTGAVPNHSICSVRELISAVSIRIGLGIKCNRLPIIPIYEILNFETISEDLGHLAVTFEDFLETLQTDLDANSSMTVAVSELASCPALELSLELGKPPSLMSIFDQLLKYWMSNLPGELSNRSRGANFKIIRKVAIDLYLSSLGVSLQTKISTPVNSQLHEAQGPPVQNLTDPRLHDEPRVLYSSQAPSAQGQDEDGPLLLFPSKSPSDYSYAASSFDLQGDSAISRLQKYAVSIKIRSVLGRPAFLKAWPNTPGSDPSSYIYDAAVEVSSGGEESSTHRQIKARRRRRTERFLRQLNDEVGDEAFQHVSFHQPSASQQDKIYSNFSSQVAEEISMTQPDRGVYGCRSVNKNKKRKKQRTAGF